MYRVVTTDKKGSTDWCFEDHDEALNFAQCASRSKGIVYVNMYSDSTLVWAHPVSWSVVQMLLGMFPEQERGNALETVARTFAAREKSKR